MLCSGVLCSVLWGQTHNVLHSHIITPVAEFRLGTGITGDAASFKLNSLSSVKWGVGGLRCLGSLNAELTAE